MDVRCPALKYEDWLFAGSMIPTLNFNVGFTGFRIGQFPIKGNPRRRRRSLRRLSAGAQLERRRRTQDGREINDRHPEGTGK
jgi:hypothetical protein